MSNSIKELYDYDLIKRCTKCENISLKSNFHRNSKSKDELHSECKTCRKKSSKQYYNDNRDLILNQKKNYYNENRDNIFFRESNI